MEGKLINFIVDKEELIRFDAVVSMLNRTRTSVLTELMRGFCVHQVVEVEKRNRKLEELNQALLQQTMLETQASHRRLMAKPEGFDDGPPSIFYDDGSDFNETNF
ncbi:hypothetical protein [Novosphingobium sp. AAP83]|uniref:hypothetical protein n=1 Tax=Novosphingobium sp. AAP83 TaxID=1523425 RepID=UPI000AF2AA9F|nr:hypothetical protein [Novosphingobium sp. AAP83]